MAQTSNSASTAYVNPPQFLEFYTKPIVADMLRRTPSYPPPSYLAIIDPSNPANNRLQAHLNAGAGEIESACAIAKRYVPTDLQALTGVSLLLLQKLNAARGMWSLAQYLKPISARPEDVPFAKESAELLEMLKDGSRIFTTMESEEAGLASVVGPDPSLLKVPNVVRYAVRLFPSYQINGPVNFPGRRGCQG